VTRRTFFNRPEDAATVILPPFPKNEDDTDEEDGPTAASDGTILDRSSPEYEARLAARQEKIRIYRDKLMKYNWKELRSICGSKKIRKGKAKEPMIERLLRLYRKQLLQNEKEERNKQQQNVEDSEPPEEESAHLDSHSNLTSKDDTLNQDDADEEADTVDDRDPQKSASRSPDEEAEIETWVTRYVQRIEQYDWKTLNSMCEIHALKRSTDRHPTISRLAEHFRQRIIKEGLDGPTIRKERLKQKKFFIIPRETSKTTDSSTTTTEIYPNIKKVVQSFQEFKGRNQNRFRNFPKT
jgi:hypothetical protein